MKTTIYFARTLRSIEARAHEYNADKVYTNPMGQVLPDHSQRIRKNHIQLCEVLLRRFTRQLQHNRRTRIPASRIMANNRQLAAELHCSERTVQNLLARLIAAGILCKTYHGSLFAYEIELATGLVSTAHTHTTEEISAEIQRADTESATAEITEKMAGKTASFPPPPIQRVRKNYRII